MTARLLSLLIWAAVAASGVYWGLRLFTRPTPVPGGASVAAAPAAGTGNLSRLLGDPPAQPVLGESAALPVDSRFRLVGVVASRGGLVRGLALISVDGKPARAVAVGRELEPGLRLLSVSHRQAEFGAAPGAAAMTLALPPLAEAQRGRPGEAGAPPSVGVQGFSRPGLPAGALGLLPSARPPAGMPAQAMPPVTPPGDSHGSSESTETTESPDSPPPKNIGGLQTR